MPEPPAPSSGRPEGRPRPRPGTTWSVLCRCVGCCQSWGWGPGTLAHPPQPPWRGTGPLTAARGRVSELQEPPSLGRHRRSHRPLGPPRRQRWKAQRWRGQLWVRAAVAPHPPLQARPRHGAVEGRQGWHHCGGPSSTPPGGHMGAGQPGRAPWRAAWGTAPTPPWWPLPARPADAAAVGAALPHWGAQRAAAGPRVPARR
jgi:hypothetical protein